MAYLGYVYDSDGYHRGAVELQTAEDVANFICDKEKLNNDKMITDMMDEHVVNTFGYFVDRFGPHVSAKERGELMTAIREKQDALNLFGDED